MTEGACNYRFAGPAMKPHWARVKWNVKHILDFKTTNPHTTERKLRAQEDLIPSLLNIPVRYAKLCPTKAGKVQFTLGLILLVSLVVNMVLAGLYWL